MRALEIIFEPHERWCPGDAKKVQRVRGRHGTAAGAWAARHCSRRAKAEGSGSLLGLVANICSSAAAGLWLEVLPPPPLLHRDGAVLGRAPK